MLLSSWLKWRCELKIFPHLHYQHKTQNCDQIVFCSLNNDFPLFISMKQETKIIIYPLWLLAKQVGSNLWLISLVHCIITHTRHRLLRGTAKRLLFRSVLFIICFLSRHKMNGLSISGRWTTCMGNKGGCWMNVVDDRRKCREIHFILYSSLVGRFWFLRYWGHMNIGWFEMKYSWSKFIDKLKKTIVSYHKSQAMNNLKILKWRGFFN